MVRSIAAEISNSSVTLINAPRPIRMTQTADCSHRGRNKSARNRQNLSPWWQSMERRFMTRCGCWSLVCSFSDTFFLYPSNIRHQTEYPLQPPAWGHSWTMIMRAFPHIYSMLFSRKVRGNCYMLEEDATDRVTRDDNRIESSGFNHDIRKPILNQCRVSQQVTCSSVVRRNNWFDILREGITVI